MPFPAHIHCTAPVFNEACSVARFITETAAVLDRCGRPWEIVLFDDGSTDGTRDEAEKLGKTLPVRVLSFPHRGIGAVIRELVAFGAALPADDAVIFTEGDGTCDPSFIPSALEKLATGSDVCVAGRYVEGSRVTGFPVRRRLQSFVSNRMLAARYGKTPQGPVTDFTIFSRVYRASAFRLVRPSGVRLDGFEANAELLVEMLSAGARVSEVPVSYRYELKSGRSKLPTARTILGYGKLFRDR